VSKSFYRTPLLDAKIVALVFSVKLKARPSHLLNLRIEPSVDESGVYPPSRCPSFSRSDRRKTRPLIPDLLQGGFMAVSQGARRDGCLLTRIARRISAGAHDDGGNVPFSITLVEALRARAGLFHILHQSWPTVNLKQLSHLNRRPGSLGRAFYAHSFKLLETSVKVVAPIVKKSFRFVTATHRTRRS